MARHYSSEHLPITRSQVRAVQTARRRAGHDDDAYHGILKDRYGITSTLDLKRGQATELLLSFGRKLPPRTKQPKPTKDSHGNITAMITRPQQSLIDHLASEVSWYQNEGFDNWLARCLKLDHRPRTKEQASDVIEGLKGLKRHGHERTA